MTKLMKDGDTASVTDLAAARRARFPQTSGAKLRLQWMFASAKYTPTPCQIIPFPVKERIASGSK